MRSRIRSLLLCCFLGTQITFSQTTTGNIEGWVFDEKGQPVIGANILITSPELQGNRGAATNEKGHFFNSSLPVGTYSVRVSHISYQKVIINDVHILLGQTAFLGEIHLSQNSLETEEVIISANKSAIDSRSTTIGKSLVSKQYTELPIERNYFNIAELLPNANHSYKGEGTNFAGGTGVENRYFVDGSEVSTPTNGFLLFELPYNFIRQVEVQTGGYQAEYPSSLGGIVNTVTYSGGNVISGTVFGFLTNNNFSGSPRLSSGQPPIGNYSDYDVGFGIGGPIVKDRLWFYTAYDPTSESEDVYIDGLGMQNAHKTTHKFAGKISLSPNQNNILILSINGNSYKSLNVSSDGNGLKVLNPEIVTYNQTSLYLNTSIKGMHNFSDKFMLESAISFYEMKSTLEPISPKGSELAYFDFVTGVESGGIGFNYLRPYVDNLSFSLRGTLTTRSHIMKAGIEYTKSSTTRDLWGESLARFPWGYDYSYNYINGTVKQRTFSTFFQDSWQLSQRLCLNAGIRWDPQWLIASDGTVAQKITDQWQPRIGIIYQPGEIGSQKITASFGRFFEPLQLSLSIHYHIKGSLSKEVIYPNDPRADTSGGQTFIANLNPFVKNVPDVGGQYYDEFSLGYERMLSGKIKIGIRGIYRYLGQGIEDAVASEADQKKYNSLQVYGNPGSGVLSMLPKIERKYLALELSLDRFAPTGFNYMISYVLSRNWGNYDGLAATYDSYGGADVWGNATNQFGYIGRMTNADGLLPNDRPHVFKFFGSYTFDIGLTMGIFFQWMSGTPLNDFGIDPIFGVATFLQPRGSVGRTPTIQDLNFRFAYDFSNIIQIGSSSKLILDVLHVNSQGTPLDYDQNHYFDYAQNYVNPHYMVPILFQPPMSFRMGMEMNF
jgi:hypothetical protein